MKLHFKENETKGGWLSSKEFELFTRIEMTDEEKAAYKTCADEIGHYIIVEYEYKGVELNMDIKGLVYSSESGRDGVRMAFDGRQHISPMKDEIQEGVKGFADHLKQIIADDGTGGETVVDL